MNIIIPMAGAGSRFKDAGYTFPKPLIEVHGGRPMIQLVLENLNMPYAHYIFLVQEEHEKQYNISSMLRQLLPVPPKIVVVDEVTEGAACTTLLAAPFLRRNESLVIANSDQFVEWGGLEQFITSMEQQNVDGGILTFKYVNPKWSYSKLNDEGNVCQVAEKNPISENATVGIYYWKVAENYVRYAQDMIAKNIRTRGEFYVCPVFNEAIEAGDIIRTHEVLKMWGLGTPEDLETFQRKYYG